MYILGNRLTVFWGSNIHLFSNSHPQYKPIYRLQHHSAQQSFTKCSQGNTWWIADWNLYISTSMLVQQNPLHVPSSPSSWHRHVTSLIRSAQKELESFACQCFEFTSPFLLIILFVSKGLLVVGRSNLLLYYNITWTRFMASPFHFESVGLPNKKLPSFHLWQWNWKHLLNQFDILD